MRILLFASALVLIPLNPSANASARNPENQAKANIERVKKDLTTLLKSASLLGCNEKPTTLRILTEDCVSYIRETQAILTISAKLIQKKFDLMTCEDQAVITDRVFLINTFLAKIMSLDLDRSLQEDLQPTTDLISEEVQSLREQITYPDQ